MSTLIQFSSYLSSLTETDFYLKREDYYPGGGGGNKARIVDYILNEAKRQSADYLLTAGGPHSNFNRALALMASSENLPLRIVLYDKNPNIEAISFNKRICDWLDTEYIHCSPFEVPETIQNQLQELSNKGFNPYFIYGGGKSLEGTQAYLEAVREIKEQNDFYPDLVITTLATGTTFAGLSAGMQSYFPKADLWGISIARKKEEAIPIITDSLEQFKKKSKLDYFKTNFDSHIIFDEFVQGGYGNITPICKDFIKKTGKNTGLILDEIYVGKALFGAIELLKKSNIWRGKKVLFLLTGGVFNF